jgi:hypothetical protein
VIANHHMAPRPPTPSRSARRHTHTHTRTHKALLWHIADSRWKAASSFGGAAPIADDGASSAEMSTPSTSWGGGRPPMAATVGNTEAAAGELRYAGTLRQPRPRAGCLCQLSLRVWLCQLSAAPRAALTVHQLHQAGRALAEGLRQPPACQRNPIREPRRSPRLTILGLKMDSSMERTARGSSAALSPPGPSYFSSPTLRVHRDGSPAQYMARERGSTREGGRKKSDSVST